MPYNERISVEDRIYIQFITDVTPKRIVNGETAVIIQSEYGTGWSTANPGLPQLLFDPVVVNFILNDQKEKIVPYCQSRYVGGNFYNGETLELVWLAQNTEFIVQDYDGLESILIKDHTPWVTA